MTEAEAHQDRLLDTACLLAAQSGFNLKGETVAPSVARLQVSRLLDGNGRPTTLGEEFAEHIGKEAAEWRKRYGAE